LPYTAVFVLKNGWAATVPILKPVPAAIKEEDLKKAMNCWPKKIPFILPE